METRLPSYTGPHPNEEWKRVTDLSQCTLREQEELAKYGITFEMCEEQGLTRGEVSHILWGYRH